MNRKPGFPSSTCSIKLPDGNGHNEENSKDPCELENSYKKRQQLITFGHSQWGFKNWNWTVTKQDLDFVDYANGKFCVGIVAFVNVSIKSLGIHREDIGYATSVATQKGSAIHNARKSSVTNALRETLLSFGGNIATLLLDQLQLNKSDSELINKLPEQQNKIGIANSSAHPVRKNSSDSTSSCGEGRPAKSDITRSPQRQMTTIGTADKPQGNNQPVAMAPGVSNHQVGPLGGPPLNQPRQVPSGDHQQPVPVSNVCPVERGSLLDSAEEELRAERKRRQRQKQEEFKRKLQNNATSK